MYEMMNIEFERLNDELLSAWEIGKIVESYGSYYYKIILVQELKEILNSGVNPADIFVLHKSFKVNGRYSKLHNELNNKNLKNIYTTAGLPFSMRPNQRIEGMKELLNCFRLCNEELYKIRAGKVKIQEIETLINRLLSNKYASINELFTSISNMCLVKINENRKGATKESQLRIKSSIEEVVRKSVFRIEKFNDLDIEFKRIERNFEDEEEEYNEVIKSAYYSKFSKLFDKVNRPIVGYIDLNNKIKILGVEHINKELRDESFLDVVYMGHNSPFKSLFAAGFVGAAGTLIQLMREEKRNSQLHIKELEKADLDIKIREIQLAKEKIELIDRIIEMYEKRGIPIDMNIVSGIIGKEIEEIEKAIQAGTKNLVYDNNMRLVNLENNSTFDERR